MERMKIQLQNIEPADHQIDHFKSKFGHALGAGPSDATLCCCISKEGDLFVLNMRIHSVNGHIPIHCQNENLDSLVDSAVSSMKSSFKDWHNAPEEFARLHHMGEKPCFHGDGSVMNCPLGFCANKKHEEKACQDETANS